MEMVLLAPVCFGLFLFVISQGKITTLIGSFEPRGNFPHFLVPTR